MAEIRVILVGRTGLEQSLRRDVSIELVRAHSPLEAIGELKQPIDGDSPHRAVVVMAPDAEPRESADALDQWSRAMRRVDPGVRLLRASPNGNGTIHGAYDGVVDASASIDRLRAHLEGHSESSPEPNGGPDAGIATPAPSRPDSEAAPAPGHCAEPAETGARQDRDPDADVARPGTPDFGPSDGRSRVVAASAGAYGGFTSDPPEGPALDEPGDRRVLDAVIQGREPLEPALSLIRSRLGADAAFVPDAEGACEGPLDGASDRSSVEVAWRGHRFGWLRAPGVDEARLRAHAGWLAGWLRLGEQQRELRHGAFSDPLTGAWNRRYFDRFLQAAIRRAHERRESVTVLVFDIDDFKHYNDRYGHAAGDEILIEMVRLIGSLVRPTDRVCRIGGDEFAVVFDEPEGPRDPGSKPPASIWQISQRFQDQVCRQRFPKLGPEAPGTLTISGGLATYPWDGRDPRELIDRADALALESKQAGKNAITFGPGAARVCGSMEDEGGVAPEASRQRPPTPDHPGGSA